jgi:tetratricopeptide (TPR) repeat protein
VKTPLFGVLLLLMPVVVAAEPPSCVTECEELQKSGDLKSGVPIEACVLRVCQESARQLYGHGRYQEALAALDYIQEERAGAPSYELERGLVFYALADFERAVVHFDRVLETIPSSFQAGAQRAHALVRLGRFDEAIAQFEKLLELPGAQRSFRKLKTTSYILGNLGMIKLRQGKIAEAKADLDRAMEEDPKNDLAGTMRYKVLPSIEAGDLEPEAIGILEQGHQDFALGHHDKAIEEFNEVVTRWPRFEMAWWVLGGIYLARVDYVGCTDVYGRAAKARPDLTDFQVEKIRCTVLQYGIDSDEGKAAVEELRVLSESQPDNQRLKGLFMALDL